MLHTSLDGRIVRCNECFAAMLGYRVDEISGKTFQSFTFPEDVPKSNEVLKKLSVGANTIAFPAVFEKRYLRKDGSTTWMKLTVSVQRDNEGNALHYITVAQDINARKSAEEQLANALEALRANE